MNRKRTVPHRHLPAAIERQRDQVLDLEAIVDSARRTLNEAIAELHTAVRERDRAAEHLQQLVAWQEETAAA